MIHRTLKVASMILQISHLLQVGRICRFGDGFGLPFTDAKHSGALYLIGYSSFSWYYVPDKKGIRRPNFVKSGPVTLVTKNERLTTSEVLLLRLIFFN